MRIDAPSQLAALGLVERLRALRAQTEPSDGDGHGVRVRFADAALPQLLVGLHEWLGDYAIDAVAVTLDGSTYTLARTARALRAHDPDDLPNEIVIAA
jgi:hypothetical protein